MVSSLARHAQALAPSCGATSVLAIDGRAGSGKSTLGERLAGVLDCPLVSMEWLYPGWDGLHGGIELLCTQVLTPLSQHQNAYIPQYDWHGGIWGETRLLQPPPLLILEGFGCGARAATPYLGDLVWLELDEALRRQRALSREADGEVFALNWTRWAAQENALLDEDDIPSRASLIINTDGGDSRDE